MNIAIFNDDPSILSELASLISSLFVPYDLSMVIETFSVLDELLERSLNSGFFDIYFLDIDASGADVIAVAKKIRHMNAEKSLLVYMSDRAEMVFEVLETQPMAFLRKQLFAEDIGPLVRWLCDHVSELSNTVITVCDETGHAVKIDYKSVLYVEAKEKYQDIAYVDGRQMLRCSMNTMEETLAPWGFFRVHRSYLVNLLYVRKMEPGCVVLENGTRLPVSRQRRKKTQEALQSYLSALKRKRRFS
ncbi:MAG: LytTR family DNA-binding domain-containing protein [Lachnospiraceae bacterium]|nr:LytTR family DNA-binding domain-containing protein [Lachnospiraceae bacterium]